jgi:anti-sigma factor RsiW
MMSSDEQLEFLLSQYLDDTLPAPQRKALEARLAEDSNLRARLDEYAKLDDLLHTALPTPRIHWDDFANQISTAVSAAPRPARSYRLPGALIGAAALAACALLAIGVTLRESRQTPPTVTVAIQTAPAPVEIAQANVIGPEAESPAGAAWSNVGLVPPPAAADDSADAYAPVVDQPSHVYIASALYTPDRSNH